MPNRALYFGILKKAFGSLCAHSDARVARAAGRFFNLYDLMDLSTRAGSAPTIDRVNSGFPVLAEVMRIGGDLRKGPVSSIRSPSDVVEEMLDEMIVSKRLPSNRQIEDMAASVYGSRLSQLGRGQSGADDVVGAAPVDTFKRVSPQEITQDVTRLIYEWDYWPALNSKPFVTSVHFETSSEDIVELDNWLRVEALRIAQSHTGAGMSILSLGQALDRLQKVRAKSIERITFNALETPVFHVSNEEFFERLAGVEDENDAWILHFEIESLKSKGTLRKGGGVLRSDVLSEDFDVDVERQETKTRGCTRYDRHALMSASTYKAIADKEKFLAETTIHVLSDDGAILNENI